MTFRRRDAFMLVWMKISVKKVKEFGPVKTE